MSKSKVRHFKLVNGEQILAAVNSKNKDNWYLGTPVQISQGLLSSYQFSPWFPFSDEENFKVTFGNVVNSTPVTKDVEEAYIKFVLSLKKNPPPPIKLDSNRESLVEKMEELEMQVQEEMNDMFEEGSFGTKKKILH